MNPSTSEEVIVLEEGIKMVEEPNFCGFCGKFCNPVVRLPT